MERARILGQSLDVWEVRRTAMVKEARIIEELCRQVRRSWVKRLMRRINHWAIDNEDVLFEHEDDEYIMGWMGLIADSLNQNLPPLE